MKTIRVALCGNPNVGKSTVFNALTGLRQHTGNWAGKTVETACGEVSDNGFKWQLVDLPGAYSLLNGSLEEQVASDYLMFQKPDVAIVVCDATCLERNLNLALQMMQMCLKTVLCVNMMDEAAKQGLNIRLEELQNQLQIPVVGISARNRRGLEDLKKAVRQAFESTETVSKNKLLDLPDWLEVSVARIASYIDPTGTVPDSAAQRALVTGEAFVEKLMEVSTVPAELQVAVQEERRRLLTLGYTREKLVATLVSASYEAARRLCEQTVRKASAETEKRQLSIDRLLSNKWIGFGVMLCLLAAILFITIIGANRPSEWLSSLFSRGENALHDALTALGLPVVLIDLLVSGIFRVTGWVVSVMLPPMAIFFPLFTLLEDMGLLPRLAFNLDKCFQRCNACGKQALCMCMGLGCNAVGVTGCRIIQSPRERLIAILTNALMPCNGRFPTLIALISMFLITGSAMAASALGAIWLAGLIVASMLMTWLCSLILSKTVLRGIPSAFALELPPFRKPKLGETLVRSVLDRTLFVLGRAVAVAAPAGFVVWCLANLSVNGQSLLQIMASALQPFGLLIGMDGAILLAFVLGFPANEIVLPLLMMIYLDASSLTELYGLDALRMLFVQNGWTIKTAVCVITFALFHWPCSTTTITIYKETHSVKWTLLGIVLPTLAGVLMCMLINGLF